MIGSTEAFRDILKNLREENLAIFAGSGMSVPSGFVDWKGLLKPIAEELKLDIDKESDLISLAQYHCNEYSTRSKINQLITDELNLNAAISENHKTLSRLPINTFWTTNYDKLIEKSLEDVGKIPDVKYFVNQLASTKPKRDAIVYKMHGDIDHLDQIIITKADYESYHLNMSPFINTLTGDLISKTFLFIGFSFSDPNIDYILSRVRTMYNQNQRRHYCFLKREQFGNNEDHFEFEYRKRKQDYFVNDLRRYSIETIFVEDYSEITIFLKNLEKELRRNAVYISGAGHEFGKWDKNEIEGFVHKISGTLIERNYQIVSGVGLGIGSSVISGALESIYRNYSKKIRDALILRPFPQTIQGKEYWSKYRNEMISYAGIALFLFGNKLEGGTIIDSSGMWEEFQIAKEKGLFLLPIGSTGYVSKKIHQEISNNFYNYYPDANETFKQMFIEIGDESREFSDIEELIFKLLKLIGG